jgi:hypothetical protein
MLFDSIGFKSAYLEEKEGMEKKGRERSFYFAKFKSNLTFFFE